MPPTGPSSCHGSAPGDCCSWTTSCGAAQITDPEVTDANTTALRAFNDLVASDDRVDTVVLTAFDGLTIARRR